jgi:homoserine O-acetyltransferase
LLGSCHGTTGAADPDFPTAAGEHATDVPAAEGGKGSFSLPWSTLPATVTTWDQARSLAMTLDALGVERVHLVTGGSLGGMVALALAAAEGERIERVAPLGATLAASAWLLAWNHVARRVLTTAMERGDVEAGLSLARQLAMISYRAPASLEGAQGRTQIQKIPWHPQAPYRVQTWLENHGSRLAARFDARAYYCLLGAMDHHDLLRPSPEGRTLADLRARTHAVAIENDMLFVPADAERLAVQLERRGAVVVRDCMHSAHGHDALFLAWEELARVLRAALS